MAGLTSTTSTRRGSYSSAARRSGPPPRPMIRTSACGRIQKGMPKIVCSPRRPSVGSGRINKDGAPPSWVTSLYSRGSAGSSRSSPKDTTSIRASGFHCEDSHAGAPSRCSARASSFGATGEIPNGIGAVNARSVKATAPQANPMRSPREGATTAAPMTPTPPPGAGGEQLGEVARRRGGRPGGEGRRQRQAGEEERERQSGDQSDGQPRRSRGRPGECHGADGRGGEERGEDRCLTSGEQATIPANGQNAPADAEAHQDQGDHDVGGQRVVQDRDPADRQHLEAQHGRRQEPDAGNEPP